MSSRNLSCQEKKDTFKKALQTIYMAKKKWNTGKKYKVLKRHINLTGINKVPIVS